MTGKRLFRLIRRSTIGLPRNERLRRTTLESLATYIAFLKHDEEAKAANPDRVMSANNNTKPWEL